MSPPEGLKVMYTLENIIQISEKIGSLRIFCRWKVIFFTVDFRRSMHIKPRQDFVDRRHLPLKLFNRLKLFFSQQIPEDFQRSTNIYLLKLFNRLKVFYRLKTSKTSSRKRAFSRSSMRRGPLKVLYEKKEKKQVFYRRSRIFLNRRAAEGSLLKEVIL